MGLKLVSVVNHCDRCCPLRIGSKSHQTNAIAPMDPQKRVVTLDGWDGLLGVTEKKNVAWHNPSPSNWCWLNPKGLLSGTLYHLNFGHPVWKVQETTFLEGAIMSSNCIFQVKLSFQFGRFYSYIDVLLDVFLVWILVAD